MKLFAMRLRMAFVSKHAWVCGSPTDQHPLRLATIEYFLTENRDGVLMAAEVVPEEATLATLPEWRKWIAARGRHLRSVGNRRPHEFQKIGCDEATRVCLPSGLSGRAAWWRERLEQRAEELKKAKVA